MGKITAILMIFFCLTLLTACDDMSKKTKKQKRLSEQLWDFEPFPIDGKGYNSDNMFDYPEETGEEK